MSQRKPFIFIGSSSEGKKYADALVLNLSDECECNVWHKGLFGLSEGTLETLVNAVDTFDFAILVLTADDLTKSRDKDSNSPRDNVIFELGLFMGGLGRQRVFIVVNATENIKMPSDLSGITVATFDQPAKGNLETALTPPAIRIKYHVQQQGLRKQTDLVKNYSRDLQVISNYLDSKGLTMITLETLKNIVDNKYDENYVSKIIEANPDKITKSKLSGNRPGVKILSSNKEIYREKFKNLNH